MKVILLRFGALLVAVASVRGADSRPTFTKDIAPILYKRCVSCHRAGDIAPMQLTTYEQVRPWSAAIKQSVQQRKMPPWFADPHFGNFRNDRRLSEEQIDTVVRWVNAGSPKGDPKDMPPMPNIPEGWSFERPPDMVVEMPLVVQVPAAGQLDMMNYYVKVPFNEERFIEGVELRPGNRSVVHHSIVNVVTIPDPVTPEQLRSGKKLGTMGWKLIGQAPGKGAEMHIPGVAKLILPNTYFEFNMHYTPNGKPATDRSVLGIWFSKEQVRHEVLTRSMAVEVMIDGKKINRGQMPKIPANVDNWAIAGQTVVKDDITLYSLSPHMHFRGKDMRYSVKYPDGKDEVLLSVPRYNYEWQLNYEFENSENSGR